MTPMVEITPKQTLMGFDKVLHSREWAYVLVDRTRNVCVLTQRLPEGQRFLSSYIDQTDPPSLPSLYESCHGKLRGGYVHRRWRCIRTELPDCAGEFERQRRGCARSIVLAQPHHLKVINA